MRGPNVKKRAAENPAAIATRKTASKPHAQAQNAAVEVDARISMGMFFTLTGTILTAFGLSTRSNTEAYAKSLGINVNLWWGLALLVFGIVLLTLGRRGQARMEKAGNRE